MDERLSRIICCPACHSGLRLEGQSLVCSKCGEKYELTPGGKVIFIKKDDLRQICDKQDQGRSGSALHNYYLGHRDSAFAKFARSAARALIPPPFVYLKSRKDVLELLFPAGEERLVVDLGAGSNAISEKAIALDIDVDSSAGIISRIERLPFADGSLDGVTACGVIEHVKRPWEVVREITRVIKPGGHVYVEAPLLQGIHCNPFDEQRFTPDGLETLFAGMQTVKKGVASGPGSALAHVLPEWLAMVFSFGSRFLFEILCYPFSWMTFWIKYTDAFLLNHPNAFRAPFGVYYLGRKPG